MKHANEKTVSACDLDSLSQANLEKIYCTVMDIEDKLQINPGSAEVEIGWRFRNRTEAIELLDDLECRIEALTFLQRQDVISNHDCHQMTPLMDQPVVVSVNVPAFRKFRQTISEAYKTRGARGSSAVSASGPPLKPKAIREDTDVVYEVKLTPAREILVNGFLLAKLDFNSENDNIFSYIYENPNRTVGIEELAKRLGGEPPKKPLHKIIENCGFTLEMKKLFFNISKASIYFRNPIHRKDLDQLGLGWLKLRCR